MTKGYGCGKLVNVDNRIYGLGKMCCYAQWLFSSENGKLKLEKSMIKAKSIVKKENKSKDKEAREKLKTKSELERTLQQVINSIIHFIDKDVHCISSQKPIQKGQLNAGHMWSRGAYPELRFNLHNIFAQSIHDNMYLSGNPIGFLEGLSCFYGSEYKEYVEQLKNSYKSLKLSREEIIDATSKAREALSWLKEKNLVYGYEDRVNIRTAINNKIGIYTENPEFYNN